MFLKLSSNNIFGGDNITFKYRYRKQIIIGLFALLSIISLSIFIVFKMKDKKKNDTDIVFLDGESKDDKLVNKDSIDSSEKIYQVDIKGEVVNPGIYSLKENSRVIDVINSAGGLRENADTSVINLSKKVWDEMVIIIYSRDQVMNFKDTKEEEKQVQTMCNQIDENALINDGCVNDKILVNGKVSLNYASLEELLTLPGIGVSKAKDIITYREENGLFKTIEDIKKVSGIGDSLFAKIKEDITV